MPPTELIFVCLALLILGACVGSFLNVVVYRLPANISLAHPASHCPHCSRPIRPWDNIPVVGWLALRGRCRDCGAAISPRYPLVEALTAIVFPVVGLAALYANGWQLQQVDWALEAGYDLWLLCTLLCVALIAWDGERPPVSLFWTALAVGLAMPLAWPQVGIDLLPLVQRDGHSRGVDLLLRLHAGAIGLQFGLLVTFGRFSFRFAQDEMEHPLVASLWLAAIYWGWLSAATSAILLAIVATTTRNRIESRRHLPIFLSGIAIAYVLAARVIANVWSIDVGNAGAFVVLLITLLVVWAVAQTYAPIRDNSANG